MTNAPEHSVPNRWALMFFSIWTGQALSLLGSALVQFALIWWIAQKTGSATILATVSLVALLPQVVLAPFVGPLVDRWSRRLIMILADSGIAAATGVLMYLFTIGQVEVWHIYAICLIRSVGGAFHFPAMAASTSLMVPDRYLTRIAGANQFLHGLLNISAPPLGALLINFLPTQSILAIDIFTAAMAVFPLLFIDIPQPMSQALKDDLKKTTYGQDLREGFMYVAKWPGLRGLILLMMTLNFLLSPSSALIPLLISKDFGGGAQQLALAEAVLGIGVILGGLSLGAWGGFKRRILTTLAGVAGIGVSIVLTGVAPIKMFWLVLVGQFSLGFTQVFANGPIMAIFQSTIPPEMQGRAFSLISAGATAMMPVSLLVAGPIADALGVKFWYTFGGCTCILISMITYCMKPIRNIEENVASPTMA